VAEHLRNVTMVLSILGIGIWILTICHKKSLLRYSIPVFIFLGSTAARYIAINIVGYDAVSAGGQYNTFFSAWTTYTNLYLVIVLLLGGFIAWKD
jgi:hypothetical protein